MAKGVAIPPSAYYALLFNTKVRQGFYPKEEVSCFCGSKEYKKITEKDRYGIDYQLCLCKNCGLLYSNPRMTKESLKLFYENDYRNIYGDRGEIGDIQNKQLGNSHIKDLINETLESLELPLPKVVFEIGCGTGGNLIAFNKDCMCIGVDYDKEAIEAGIKDGLDLREGGIEILEGLNIKADLIIMNHVLEHFTDIESDLLRIRELLSDKGVLYVTVPGLYAWDIRFLFQNAHNYQFNGNTLAYVMYSCGFNEWYLTEEIESVWFKVPDKMDKSNKDPMEHEYIDSYITGDKFLLPPIRCNCKFTTKEIKQNIKNTINLGIPQITELIQTHPNSEAVIVCGGSTIDNYPDKIKELKAKGAYIYSIDRMYSWCLNHDIVPDYVVALDASEDVVEGFKNIHDDTTHILTAQCRPEVFEMLKGKKVYYFLIEQKWLDYRSLFKDIDIEKITFMRAGSSVSLATMVMAITMGSRNIHVFGFDCHIGNGDYAKGIVGVGSIDKKLDVEIDGRTFNTTTAFFAFMQHFFELYHTAKENKLLDKVLIYGDSMVKKASRIDLDGDKVAD